MLPRLARTVERDRGGAKLKLDEPRALRRNVEVFKQEKGSWKSPLSFIKGRAKEDLRWCTLSGQNRTDRRCPKRKSDSPGLRACRPATEPKSPESHKIRKNYEKMQNRPPRGGPRKYEKNTKMVQNWPILYFLYFFFVLLGPNPGWAISHFFNFFGFLRFRGFWAL